MRSDTEIRLEVEAEVNLRLGGEPMRVDALVHDGIVMLSGFVCSYAEKYGIENAVKTLAGVAGVVNEIEVRSASCQPSSDDHIRNEAIRALRTEVPAAFDRLKVLVRDGEVTLAGTVAWQFLRERAEYAVRRVGGITVVHNMITLEPEALSREVKDAIEQALRRTSWTAAGDLSVQAQEGSVTLRGHVPSDADRQIAEQAAWSVHGVVTVKNELAAKA